MRYLCFLMLFIVSTAHALELSNEPIFTFGRGVITHLAYSPDSKYLAVSSPYSIELLETDGYTLVTSWGAESYEVAFSPDGKTLASRSKTSLELFDVPSGKMTRLTNAPNLGMAFRKDGRLMAWFNGNELQVWNTQDRKLEERKNYDMGGGTFAYSPNREYVMTISGNKAKILHLSAGKIQTINILDLCGGGLDSFFLTDEYFYCKTYPDIEYGHITRCNIASEKLESISSGIGGVRHIAVSMDGRYLAVNDASKGAPAVYFSDMTTGRSRTIIGKGIQGESDLYYYMAFSPDKRYLALSLGDRLLYWDINQLGAFGGTIAKDVKAITSHLMPAYSLSFSKDSRSLAVGEEAGVLSVWDTHTGALINNIVTRNRGFASAQFISNDKVVALGGCCWGVNINFITLNNEAVDSWAPPEGWAVCQSMSLSPDGKILAGSIFAFFEGTGNDGVYLWDAQTHQLVDKLVHSHRTTAVAFHPDGQLLAAGDDGANLKIWDWKNKKVLHELRGHTNTIRSISFTRDGSVMVSSGDDGIAIIWDTKKWSEINSGSFNGNKAVINPQGNIIAMGCYDGKVDLVVDEWIVETPWSHRDNVEALAFSPDGLMLATGSLDGTVKLWAIPAGNNKSPSVKLTSNYKVWQSGALRLTAEASDPDGTVASVSFQYSTSEEAWQSIGEDKTAPYEVIWDTVKSIPIGAESVWLRAVATDNKGGIAAASSTESFGIANVGTPSGGMQAFTLSLDAGLHNISLPLKPETTYTARTFAQMIGSSIVVQYDEDADKFSAFLPNIATIDGFTIKGGHGYIINLPEAKQITFTGTAWSGAPARAQTQPLDKLWAYAVGGQLPDGIEASQLTLLNPRNGMQAQAESQGEGRYAAALVGAEGEPIVSLDDVLEIRTGWRVIAKHRIIKPDLRLAYSVMDIESLLPSRTMLLQNYPNPFNPETWIPYELTESADVIVRIYDAQGKLIRTLALGHQPAGCYVDQGTAAYWDGKNDAGENVSAGVYFYSLSAGSYNTMRKMAIVK